MPKCRHIPVWHFENRNGKVFLESYHQWYKGQHLLYTRLGTSTNACTPLYTPWDANRAHSHAYAHTHTIPQAHPPILYSSLRFNFTLRTPSPLQTSVLWRGRPPLLVARRRLSSTRRLRRGRACRRHGSRSHPTGRLCHCRPRSGHVPVLRARSPRGPVQGRGTPCRRRGARPAAPNIQDDSALGRLRPPQRGRCSVSLSRHPRCCCRFPRSDCGATPGDASAGPTSTASCHRAPCHHFTLRRFTATEQASLVGTRLLEEHAQVPVASACRVW